MKTILFALRRIWNSLLLFEILSVLLLVLGFSFAVCTNNHLSAVGEDAVLGFLIITVMIFLISGIWQINELGQDTMLLKSLIKNLVLILFSVIAQTAIGMNSYLEVLTLTLVVGLFLTSAFYATALEFSGLKEETKIEIT